MAFLSEYLASYFRQNAGLWNQLVLKATPTHTTLPLLTTPFSGQKGLERGKLLSVGAQNYSPAAMRSSFSFPHPRPAPES